MPWIRSSPYDAQTITHPNTEPGSKFISKNDSAGTIPFEVSIETITADGQEGNNTPNVEVGD
jgi:hypothetical protein